MRLENVVVEDVRLHGEGQAELARLKPTVNQYMVKKVPGFIRNVQFKDVRVEGTPGKYSFDLEGADSRHDVRGVALDKVSILGEELNRETIKTNGYVSGVTFGP